MKILNVFILLLLFVNSTVHTQNLSLLNQNLLRMGTGTLLIKSSDEAKTLDIEIYGINNLAQTDDDRITQISKMGSWIGPLRLACSSLNSLRSIIFTDHRILLLAEEELKTFFVKCLPDWQNELRKSSAQTQAWAESMLRDIAENRLFNFKLSKNANGEIINSTKQLNLFTVVTHTLESGNNLPKQIPRTKLYHDENISIINEPSLLVTHAQLTYYSEGGDDFWKKLNTQIVVSRSRGIFSVYLIADNRLGDVEVLLSDRNPNHAVTSFGGEHRYAFCHPTLLAAGGYLLGCFSTSIRDAIRNRLVCQKWDEKFNINLKSDVIFYDRTRTVSQLISSGQQQTTAKSLLHQFSAHLWQSFSKVEQDQLKILTAVNGKIFDKQLGNGRRVVVLNLE